LSNYKTYKVHIYNKCVIAKTSTSLNNVWVTIIAGLSLCRKQHQRQ